jgi:hypothetical protein
VVGIRQAEVFVIHESLVALTLLLLFLSFGVTSQTLDREWEQGIILIERRLITSYVAFGTGLMPSLPIDLDVRKAGPSRCRRVLLLLPPGALPDVQSQRTSSELPLCTSRR